MWHTKRDAFFKASLFLLPYFKILLTTHYVLVDCIDSSPDIYHLIAQCLVVAFPLFSEDKLVRELVNGVNFCAFYMLRYISPQDRYVPCIVGYFVFCRFPVHIIRANYSSNRNTRANKPLEVKFKFRFSIHHSTSPV